MMAQIDSAGAAQQIDKWERAIEIGAEAEIQ